jgi:hypothetical protein
MIFVIVVLTLRMDVGSDDLVIRLGLEKWLDIDRRVQHRRGFLLFLVEKLVGCSNGIY